MNKMQLLEANQQFLKNLQKRPELTLNLIEVMAKFHKYDLNGQIGIYLQNGEEKTALAKVEIWKNLFKTELIENAQPIYLVHNGTVIETYDISDTKAYKNGILSANILWQYNDQQHKDIFINIDGDTVPEKILHWATAAANEKSLADSEIAADVLTAIVLLRMKLKQEDGILEEISQRLIEKLQNDENIEIVSLLEPANEMAREFLNRVGNMIQAQDLKAKNELQTEFANYVNLLSQNKQRAAHFIDAEIVELPVEQELDFAQTEKYVDAQFIDKIDLNTDLSGINGKKEAFKVNMAAIQLMKKLEKENRPVKPDEIAILKSYVGFGGLSEAFDQKNDTWQREYRMLHENLTPEEFRSSRATVNNAHYTDNEIIRAIYQGLQKSGFRYGNILEPAAGSGKFFENMPAEMRMNSKLFGVELDALTSRIARIAYQDVSFVNQGFETTTFSEDSFDLAISNVPFGNYGVIDRKYDKHHFLIHDYFLAKMIEQVRPGGLVVAITSHGTMDKKNANVREFLARKAELVRAIRLPNTAFKKAGTAVTTDLIILKKREQAIDERDPLPLDCQEWIESVACSKLAIQNYRVPTVNKYFLEHPEFVLGDLAAKTNAYGVEITCIPSSTKSLFTLLEDALDLPEIYEKSPIELPEPIQVKIAHEKKALTYYLENDKLIYVKANGIQIESDITESQKMQLTAIIKLKEALYMTLEAQEKNCTDEELAGLQHDLNRAYDDYVGRYNRIREDKALKKLYQEDVAYPLLRALEVYEKGEFRGKCDIFYQRTIRPHITPEHADTPLAALKISMQEKGKADLSYMEELTGISQSKIIEELEYTSIYYDFQSKEYQLVDEYLSGDIYAKISYLQKEAVEATDDVLNKIERNINALNEVKPKPLTADEITVNLGATWIPESDITDFIKEAFGKNNRWAYQLKVKYSPITGTWNIENKSVGDTDALSKVTFGTNEYNAFALVEAALNLREPKVYKTVYMGGKETKIVDIEKTVNVQHKMALVKQEFKKWIWQSEERTKRLVAYYNSHFNNIRPREYNGEHLVFPGMNCNISLRKHQKDAIAHTLYGGNTLLAHCVGAGKTFEMVASIMESKRLGIARKPMVVVPKHLTEQFGAEFLQLYPHAKILVANQNDFEKENRKEFVSKIATQNWDAIIMGYSQFEKIPLSQERIETFLQQEMDGILKIISEKKGDSWSVKQAETKRRQIQKQLEKLQSQERKDTTIIFEQLGIDRIYIDEAHYFKNLYTFTKMNNVSGIQTTDAKKTQDLYMKCKYINELTNCRGLIFATGTPVSNSMAEIYTLQRYLQPDRLKSEGLASFDEWASTFGQVVTSLEISPEGNGFREKSRFAKFHNLPELMSMFREIADIKTPDMINLPVPEVEYEVCKIPASTLQKQMVEKLAYRAEKIRAHQVDSRIDNMLKVTNEGRCIALDPRIINANLSDEADSKVNKCIENVYAICKETDENKSTQIIFCDLSTPTNKEFNVYADIKKKLIQMGISEAEIAFIHDAKTEKKKEILFEKVRAGEVRILLGSTSMLGVGTNIQDKLICTHDLDVPWRPSDLEQRKGRIVRQGNENKQVKIYRYVTAGTFDAYLWVRREVA